MEPFYAWQSMHEAGNESGAFPLVSSSADVEAKQQAKVKPTRRFKQLTLVDAICTALLS
jgi:hypothetical protein